MSIKIDCGKFFFIKNRFPIIAQFVKKMIVSDILGLMNKKMFDLLEYFCLIRNQVFETD